MPHDANGEDLKVGDTVKIQCIIKRIEITEDYCNITVYTTRKMPPNDTETILVLNSKQVVRSS